MLKAAVHVLEVDGVAVDVEQARQAHGSAERVEPPVVSRRARRRAAFRLRET